ncbi:hypothetical protein NL676_016310 [Syzygium grande]|nr:hypothetical protein NL676_016310 [Syzygium grande]
MSDKVKELLREECMLEKEKSLDNRLFDAKMAALNVRCEINKSAVLTDHYEKELKEKRNELSSMQEEAVAAENQLNSKRREDRVLESEVVRRWEEEIRKTSVELAILEFTYSDPIENFDRSKVKGVVAKLFKVRDSSRMTALGAAAGEHLYSVAVDTIETARQLIKNGNLLARKTFIPLDTIQPHVVPPNVQQAAALAVGEENIELALSLVDYDEESQVAKEIHTTSVTLEGGISRPIDDGLLSGGCSTGGGDLLRLLHYLAEAETEAAIHWEILSTVEGKITELSPLQKKLSDLNSELELQSLDLSLFRSRVEEAAHHKLGELVKKIEQKLAESKSATKEKQILHDKCVATVSSLEGELASLKSLTEGTASDVEEGKSKGAFIRKAREQAQVEPNQIQQKLKESDPQIIRFAKKQQELQAALREKNREKKECESDCQLGLEEMIRRQPWIASKIKRGGTTSYGFGSTEMSKARTSWTNNEGSNLAGLRQDEKSNTEKRIVELKEKEEETMKDTLDKVDIALGSIVSAILLSTLAKLEPPEGSSFLDGLEVSVAFDSVGKQSLSGVGGGQGSLLALSLLFALQLFKPTPVYIVDEKCSIVLKFSSLTEFVDGVSTGVKRIDASEQSKSK